MFIHSVRAENEEQATQLATQRSIKLKNFIKKKYASVFHANEIRETPT
jgi:hypothetical protein